MSDWCDRNPETDVPLPAQTRPLAKLLVIPELLWVDAESDFETCSKIALSFRITT